MAHTHPKDTLAYHLARPLTSHLDRSKVPMAVVAKTIKGFLDADTHKSTQPVSEALAFYGLNHGLAILGTAYDPFEPMASADTQFVTDTYDRLTRSAVRAFVYLMLICTREARHNASLSASLPKMAKLFGNETAQWFNMNGGEGTIHTKMLQSPPNTTLGNFVDCIRWQFYNSSWPGGYGGKAWGQVTDCLYRYVMGEFTAEMMLDTNWTLAHNNGPIFNKGHCYATHHHTIIKVLDVQRSGQIPELIFSDSTFAGMAPPGVLTALKQLGIRYPGSFGTYVDWYKVEALGAVHTYPNEKNAQKASHGSSPYLSAKDKAVIEAAKKLAAEEAAIMAHYVTPYFEYLPDQQVKKIIMARAA